MANFKSVMQPYADRAAAALGIPVDVILAQWSLESGNGTSRFATEGNNFGGIKYSPNGKASGTIQGSSFARYTTKEQFTSDYIRVMNLSYYKDVRAAGKTGDVVATIKALGASPYDAGHYVLNGEKGGKLLNMLGLGQKKTKPPAKVCPTCHRAY